MNKNCFYCKKPIKRLKKGGISPCCAKPLHNTFKRYVPVEWHEASLVIEEKISSLIYQRDGIVVSFTPKDHRQIFIIIQKVYDFLNSQSKNIISDFVQFIRDIFDYLLSQKWWKDNLKTVSMTINHSVKVAQELYTRELRRVEEELRQSNTSYITHNKNVRQYTI